MVFMGICLKITFLVVERTIEEHRQHTLNKASGDGKGIKYIMNY
jgi:hypothetical protein